MIGLKKIREIKNLTQKQVAHDLKISIKSLSLYEKGKRSPKISLLVSMAKYFNVTTQFLIFGEEYKKR